MAGLSLIQQQKLQTKLSPAQIQVIRLLELPSIELRQRINEELQENPALEEGIDPTAPDRNEEDCMQEDDYINPLQNSDFDYDDYVNDDEKADYEPRASQASNELRDDIPIVNSVTLMEHLKEQVYLTKMTKPQRHIAKWVLGNIDNDGFLRRSIEQLVDDIAFQENLTVSDEEMEDIVKQIKQFDPPGVAAKDLQECLINQLKQKDSTEAITHAIQILSICFEPFSKHHYDKIMQRLLISEQEMKDAIDEIVRLNQKPANGFTGNTYETHKTTIIPDFYVENRDGELFLTLNTGDIPELHVSPEYNEMLQEYSGKNSRTNDQREAVHFIKQKIDSANWFIDAIRQRNETLTRTMEAIIKLQHNFFIEGDETYLRPMILQDIADRTGYDVSTISRVSNSKYVQTEFGMYPLKYFFSESLTNAEGEEISTREIKKIMQEVIAEEDKTNPLNDDQLVEVLNRHGYRIARRTVAKYREQMGIPVARLRKVF
ncbi:MAG: RNA polymerase factor sigma-54 [Paludibacteraceae bacterium]|nr:RNA polymerase factor sigma-54 [Paludibacteraceae bacterium]